MAAIFQVHLASPIGYICDTADRQSSSQAQPASPPNENLIELAVSLNSSLHRTQGGRQGMTRMFRPNGNAGRIAAQPHSPGRPGGLPPQSYRDRHRALAEIAARRTLSANERQRMCQMIAEQVLSRSSAMRSVNFTSTSTADLTTMADLYDQHFFDGHCLAIARHHGMHFRWSKRMTSNGGKTVRVTGRDPRTGEQFVRYEIVLSATLLFQTFSDLHRPIRVTGVMCNNRIQAMQRILEHELVHLVEMLVWGDSCCAAARFQSIAGRLFGHTEHKHDLITQQERAERKFNIRVGSLVEFAFEGKRCVGTVNRITRRATVLVPDPKGQLYDDGHRYAKYYIPLSHLRPISRQGRS
ncbi:MAG: hypothetical protein D6753_15265 [Planctomycetota bacterium]|nr:MAG: hypothetical protein D6753_15265 [Planctomycetota bacterium]